MPSSFRIRNLMLAVVMVPGLSACSALSALFPDKQKQYQYSTEIPPLEIPPDLIASTIQGARQQRNANQSAPPLQDQESLDSLAVTSPPSSVGSSLPPIDPESVTTPRKERNMPTSRDEASATEVRSSHYVLAESSDGTPLIEIDESYPSAWNTVGRAIGRLKLEINDQNRSDGIYYVYFGEHDTPPSEDHGLLSELFSYLKGKSAHSKEYRIKVEESGKITYVLVVDDKNHPQTEGEGLTLLQRLHHALQNLSSTRSDDEENP